MQNRHAKRKIMVVDDELEMRIFLGNLLRSHGFDPIDAGSGSDCLSVAGEAKPAVIILNAMMTRKEDHLIYQSLKQDKVLKSIPVIMLANIDKNTFSHYHKFRSLTSGQELPEPEAFLKKPFEAEELIQLILTLTQTGTATRERIE